MRRVAILISFLRIWGLFCRLLVLFGISSCIGAVLSLVFGKFFLCIVLLLPLRAQYDQPGSENVGFIW